MVNPQVQEKVASSGAVASWIGWVISHIEQINGLLQTAVLLLSITASVIAIRASRRKGK